MFTYSEIANNCTENIWLIITTILAIIAIILSYRNNRLQKLIASKQGAFQSPNLTISIYDSEWRKKAHFTPRYFILAGKLSPKRILSFPLKITLTNKGDKSAKEIKMALRYHKRLRCGGLDIAKIKPADDYSKVNFPKFIEDSNFQIAVFEIGTLTPKQKFAINDVITITEATFHNFSVDAVSKDGVSLTIPVEVHWSNSIDYTIYQEDNEPISGSFNIAFVDTSKQSLKDYLNSYNKQMAEEYKKNVGNIIQQILHFLKLKFYGIKIEREIQLVVYDESMVKRYSKLPVDEVPAEALRYYFGLKDIKGRIHIL